MKITAYLGPQGTYSEEAAIIFAGQVKKQCRLRPFPAIWDCAQAVADKTACYAVIPLENSMAGSVHETMDILMSDLKLSILGELDLRIEHCLLSPAGNISDIRRVYSHPQALAQCRGYLRNNLPGIAAVPVVSTAEAAAAAASGGPQAAAIAGRAAAKAYGLRIVAAGIEDAPSTTRFIVLGKSKLPGCPVKTSLLFTVRNSAGSLYQVLGVFAAFQVNLTKIESRPARSRLGDYVFFVDLDGSAEDTAVKAALQEVGRKAVTLRLLGSYPVLGKSRA